MRRLDAIFFVSGAAALSCEVIWARHLARIVGGDAAATALVLALFMGGLGVGAALAGPLAARLARPARAFAALELGLGAWAALSPWALRALVPLGVGGAHDVLSHAPPLRTSLACAVILPATLAMGAGFPLMARLCAAVDARRSDVARFYGANTLGACAGALLAAFVWMPRLGLTFGLVAAALLNGVAAAAVLTVRGDSAARRAPLATAGGPGAARRGLALAALLGASSMAFEVVATRVLIGVTGATAYAFAIVLGVILLGLGVGSRQAQRAAESSASAARAAGLLAALVPALSFAGWLALRARLGEADLFGVLANRQPLGGATANLWLSHAVFAALALAPLGLAFGAAFPLVCAWAAEAQPRRRREHALGQLYLANSLGAFAGSLGAGFVLLPVFGARGAAVGAALLAWGASFLAPARGPAERWLCAAAGLALGALVLAPRRAPTTLVLLAGRSATVSVEEFVESDGARVRSFRVNGKVEATTAPVDMRLQRLLGHVPALLHGDVRNALVIGMGSGMTAGALLDLPSLERLDVFELEPAVPRATRAFREFNGDLLDDARTHVRCGDGRVLLATSAERYDLITADPLHPATRGSSDLFSVEHFRCMAAHLARGGVASQWLPLYELSTRDVCTVLASWTAAFPHTSAWLTAYDLALVGSVDPPARPFPEEPLPLAVARHLSEVGVHGALDIAALCVAGTEELRARARGVAPMTLDRPSLEFRAPFSYLTGYSTEILSWAARDDFVELLPSAAQDRARDVRALLRRFLEELPSGMGSAAASYGRALLALPAKGAAPAVLSPR